MDAGDYGGDLEATARDYYRKIMANPDVQNGIDSFRAGALKVRRYLSSFPSLSSSLCRTNFPFQLLHSFPNTLRT